MATRSSTWYETLSYVKTQQELDLLLESIKNNDTEVSNKIIRNRLEKLVLTNGDGTPLRNAVAIKERIDFALGKDENGEYRIPKEQKYKKYIDEVLAGNIEKLVKLLEAQGLTSQHRNKIKDTFIQAVNNSPRKKEFMTYILNNPEAKKSIIGKIFKLNLDEDTSEIKGRTSINDTIAIDYITFIMTNSKFKVTARAELFPKDSGGSTFGPIKENTRIFPALSFLLTNKIFDKEYTWTNPISSNLKLEMTLKQLMNNYTNKKDTKAGGLQLLFNKHVTKQKSSAKETEDIGQLRSAGSRVGRFRGTNVFLKELNKNINEAEKEEFNNLLSNQTVSSAAISLEDWQLVVDFLDKKDNSLGNLKEKLKGEPILAIKSIRDVNKILDTDEKKDKFRGMKGVSQTQEGATIAIKRVTNKEDLELLDGLFNTTQLGADILTEKFDDKFIIQFKKTKTMLTDGRYNLSKLELPDVIEFMEDIELHYHNDLYAEGNSQHLLHKAFEVLDTVKNEMVTTEDGKMENPLQIALINILEVCSTQYPEIRKSFINAIKDAMQKESQRKNHTPIITWFKDNKLMEEK